MSGRVTDEAVQAALLKYHGFDSDDMSDVEVMRSILEAFVKTLDHSFGGSDFVVYGNKESIDKVRERFEAAAPHMREGDRLHCMCDVERAFNISRKLSEAPSEIFSKERAHEAFSNVERRAPPKADAVDLAPDMMIIQKSDAECLVRDLERFATTKTAGGRLAMKRVRELLSIDSSRSKP